MLLPTLKDVAEKAGVSTTTASRILNDTYRNKVSEETRRRVMRVVAEMGYRSSVPARALRAKKTFQYSLVIPNLAFSYMPEVVQGLQNVATQLDYGCLLYLAHDQPEQELNIFHTLVSLRVDGVVWMPSFRVDPMLEQMVKQCRVVEVLHKSGFSGVPGIMVDQEYGGYLAAKHLLNLGHTNIGAITGNSRHWEQRLNGYYKAFAEAGRYGLTKLINIGLADWEHGVKATNELLTTKPETTAILAASDIVATGAVYAASKMGLRVPDDLSIVGFGDQPIAQQGDLKLTTISHPKQEIGEQAMRMLAALMGGDQVPDELLKPELVVRKTTAEVASF